MTRTFFILMATIGLGAATPALAADNAMQVCGAKYQAAKKANSLPAGQTWPQYLAACRASLPKTAAGTPPPMSKPSPVGKPSVAAAPARPAAKPAAPRATGAPSAAMLAMRERQKQCGAQWKTDKAGGKVPAGQTWPQYWSACSKRLKG